MTSTLADPDVVTIALEHAVGSIMITDATGTIVYVNPAWERLTGHTASEAIGQRAQISASGRQPASFYREMWDTILARRVWRGELVNKRKDGTLYHAELTVAPVCDAAGKVTHFLGTHRDVTDEVAHRQAARELEKARTDLLGIVSHDLKTPLCNVLGYVDLVLRGSEPLTERQTKALGRILDNGRHMMDLVSDILDSAGFERGGMRLVAEDHDLREIVLEAVERSTFLADDRRIRLVADVPRGPARVPVDRGKLLQALNNLVSNAVKFSPDGATVDVALRLADSGHEISVTDHGCGIPEAEMPRLFQKFSRTSARPARDEKGTGLGLFIVKEVVALHGGTVRVESTPGEGIDLHDLVAAPVTATPASAPRPTPG